jgi:hypothetical protein
MTMRAVSGQPETVRSDGGVFGGPYGGQYAAIAYGLSNRLYTGDEALHFLAQLDGIRHRAASSRGRHARELQVRLKRLAAQMSEVSKAYRLH